MVPEKDAAVFPDATAAEPDAAVIIGPAPTSEGCGCGAATRGGSGAWLLAWLAAGWIRRRRDRGAPEGSAPR
jgi:MYXO-CTERM domain-containing protein